MAATVSRTDRRRRALQDGGLAAVAEGSSATKPSEPRAGVAYDQPEQSLSFALAQRIVPQNAWMLAGCTALGLAAVIGGVAALERISGSSAVSGIDALQLNSGRSVVNWSGSVLLLGAWCLAIVVYQMRRRRTDDFRGCYRWWLAAVAALPIAALCRGVGLHGDLAQLAGQRMGWTAESSHMASLVGPLAFVFLPLAVRLGWQLRSSPLALAQLIGSSVAYGLSVAAGLGVAPAGWTGLAMYAGPLVAGVLLIGALAAFTRRMVLEASGSVAMRATRKPKADDKKADRTAPPAPKLAVNTRREDAVSAQPSSRPSSGKVQNEAVDDASSKWVSGAESGYRDDYEEGDSHGSRLSKAERKRLRRAQADKRAA